jgi:hypothetical protein
LSRAGARPLAARAGTASPRGGARRERLAAANDNIQPLSVRLAKAAGLAAVLALVALAALTF